MDKNSSSCFSIISCVPVFRMILSLDLDGEMKTISVSLDYQNRKAYFEDNFSLNLDYVELEKKIFENLNPIFIQPPNLNMDALEKVQDLRDGKYSQEKIQI